MTIVVGARPDVVHSDEVHCVLDSIVDASDTIGRSLARIILDHPLSITLSVNGDEDRKHEEEVQDEDTVVHLPVSSMFEMAHTNSPAPDEILDLFGGDRFTEQTNRITNSEGYKASDDVPPQPRNARHVKPQVQVHRETCDHSDDRSAVGCAHRKYCKHERAQNGPVCERGYLIYRDDDGIRNIADKEGEEDARRTPEHGHA
ncbi:MAG: hypothetical protein HKN13_11930, partial [Rhodothermales bacterium]|nr:hypothetical protein [Rhodothermales bacterium]